MRVETLPLSVKPPALDPLRALPAEWESWAEEPAHQVLVEEDGEIVGALHVALVSATEAWLEGLRVRGDRQGAGIGRRLVEEGEALARRYGARAIRTAIPAHEYAAQAVAARAGFHPLVRAIVHEGRIGAGPIDIPYDAPVREVTAREVAALSSRLPDGEALSAWQGLVPLGWRFRKLAPSLMKGLVKDGRVLSAGEGGKDVAVFTVREDAAVIYLLEAAGAAAQALAGTVASLGRERGARRLVIFAPDERVRTAVRLDLRPHAWCPDGLVVVERGL